MDGIHTQLGSMALPGGLAPLPAIITGMTDREASPRLCSAHATCHLLQQPNLCCPQCASSENKSWTARREDDTCMLPVAITASFTNGLSQELAELDLNRVASTSGNTRVQHMSPRPFQDHFSASALQYNDFRNRSGRLRPEDANAGSRTTSAPSQMSAGYKVRMGNEATDFFRQGRIFSVLQSEAIPTRTPPRDAVSVDGGIRPTWGTQGVRSVERRFVIVKINKKRQSLYACEISSYGNRGALAPHCNVSEHAVIYVRGMQPVHLPGERERGMRKDPIAIELEDQTIRYEATSRLNFGKEQTFEWTVAAQLHGHVIQEHMTKLIGYYRQEHQDDSDRNDG